MKEAIHPEYVQCEVTCVCGESFTTRSTRSELRVEVCSKCHPFFTGDQHKLMDTEGRVEQFIRRYGLQSRYKQQEPQSEETDASSEQ